MSTIGSLRSASRKARKVSSNAVASAVISSGEKNVFSSTKSDRIGRITPIYILEQNKNLQSRPLHHHPLLMLGVGNRKFSNSRADSRVLVRRFNVADQGGGAGFQAGDAPGRLECGDWGYASPYCSPSSF